MTPADSHNLVSDADPPLPWSYRYSTAEEFMAVKQEPEWDDGGESEAASRASLYADHNIKDELVFGPEQLQQQDIAISMQHALIKTEKNPCMLELADRARTEHECSPILCEEPQPDQTLQQLTMCFVSLERIVLGEQHTSFSTTDKPYKCNTCQKEFAFKRHLANHMKSHIDHFCHICLKKFAYPHLLTAHMQRHKSKPFHCNLCNKLFTKSSRLIKHMLNHTKQKPYSCNICQKQFLNRQCLYWHGRCHKDTKPNKEGSVTKLPSNVTKHKKGHLKEKQYSCSICQRQFKNGQSLYLHGRSHLLMKPNIEGSVTKLPSYVTKHKKGHSNKEQYSCSICQRQFKNGQSLYLHGRSHLLMKPNIEGSVTKLPSYVTKHKKGHSNKEQYSCSICQRQFKNGQSLYLHGRSHLLTKSNNEGSVTNLPSNVTKHNKGPLKKKQYSCNICQKQFLNGQSLYWHGRSHLGTKPYKEDSVTKLPSYVTKHKEGHSKKKQYSCNVCQKQFLNGQSLYWHGRSHLGTKPYKEDSVTKLPSYVTKHNKGPLKKKQYYCNICQKQFLNGQSLYWHGRSHLGTKPYKEDSVTKLPSNVTKHNKGPLKKKQYSCSICQRRFKNGQSLYWHGRSHLGTKPNEEKQNKPPLSFTDHEKGHTKENVHFCAICQKQFVYRKALLTHMRLRHPKANNQLTETQDHTKKTHCCDICQRRFMYRKTLLTHMRIQHPKAYELLTHTQDQVKEKDYRKTLVTHMRLRHLNESNKQLTYELDLAKEKPHCCDICQRRFVHRKSLRTHMRLRHPKAYGQLGRTQDLVKDKPHCCDICQRRFMYRKTLLVHMRIRHQKSYVQLGRTQDLVKEKHHCCAICQRQFVYRKSLLTHMRLRHPKANEQLPKTHDLAKEKSHCCDICQRRFVYRKTLLTHMRLRHPKANEQLPKTHDLAKEKSHCCDICQRRFVYRKTLLTHMRLRHPKAYEQLGRTQDLVKEKDYRKTLLTHMRLRHLNVNESNKQLTYEHDLAKEKPHCCDICQRRFVHRKSLLTHMRLRHPKAYGQLGRTQDLVKDKPHCCDICQRRFMYRKTLLAHMRLRHLKVNESNKLAYEQDLAKEKPHCCDICQRRFVYRKSLLTHMRLRHPKANKQLAETQDHVKKPHCCDICQRRFMYKKTLLTHMRMQHQKVNIPDKQQVTPPTSSTKYEQDHTKQKPHCCDICQRRFVYRKSLLTHMRLRHPKANKQLAETQDHVKKPHCCDICQRRFMYKKTLLTHMRMQHQKVNIPDKQQVTPPTSSTKYEQDHTKQKPHCCDICQRRFVYRKSLLTHMRLRHPKANKQLAETQDHVKKPHCCDICQRRFMYKKTLLTHMRMQHQKVNIPDKQQVTPPTSSTKYEQDHTKQKPHCCDICQRRFVHRKTLLTHMQQHTVDKPSKPLVPPSSLSVNNTDLISHNQTHTQPKLYTCDICEKQFEHKMTLSNHLRLHSAVKPFKCNVCNKRFADLNSLTVHGQIHTMEKPYECSICNQQFTELRSLDIHKKSHNDQKAYSCNLCQKQFADLDMLIYHARRWHTAESGEKPHCCNICDEQFPKLSLLNAHKLTHTIEKPYECSVCNERFERKAILTDHSRVHIKEKAHKCNVCNKTFAFKQYLSVHGRIHTGEKPYSCDICASLFRYHSNFNKHMRKYHTGN